MGILYKRAIVEIGMLSFNCWICIVRYKVTKNNLTKTE
jgi:hypothetical protein